MVTKMNITKVIIPNNFQNLKKNEIYKFQFSKINFNYDDNYMIVINR